MMRLMASDPSHVRITIEASQSMDRIRKSKNFVLWLLILVNLPGILSYIFFASWLWVPAGQGGPFHDLRDDLLWGLLAFPFLAICTLVNFIMSRSVLIHLFLYRDFRQISLWLLIVVAWFGAVRYDLGRHFDSGGMANEESVSP